MAKTGARIPAHAVFRFSVEIDGIEEATFTECTLPGLEVEVQEQKEGGFNEGAHMLPGRVKPGRVTLKRGIARSSELLKWYAKVLEGNLAEAYRSVSVVLYDVAMQQVMRWNFEQAYPVKWTGSTLTTQGNEVAVETLELAFSMVSLD
jgi:phage tail-like protein